MNNLTSENELAIRESLKTKIETVPEIGAVFTRERFVSSKQDYFSKVSYEKDEDLEVRFCELTLLKFEDSKEEGCDDAPVVFLTYNLHIEHEFFDEREDGSNSFDSFVKAVLDLRAKFLEANRQINSHTYHDPLTQAEIIVTQDATVHVVDLQVKVTIE